MFIDVERISTTSFGVDGLQQAARAARLGCPRANVTRPWTLPRPSADSLLTVDDIARILKLNPQTVRNWIDQGYLRAIRIGRNVRVTRAEFDRLIEESYTGRRVGRTPT